MVRWSKGSYQYFKCKKEFLIEEDTQIRKTILGILLSAMENGEAASPILVIVSKD